MPLKDPEARKLYHREYMRMRYAQDPEHRRKHRKRVRACERRRKQAARRLIDDFRRRGCRLCGETEPCCLSAHHIDPTTKEDSIGELMRRSVKLDRLRRELAKCVCLCENCHRKVHAGVKTLPMTEKDLDEVAVAG